MVSLVAVRPTTPLPLLLSFLCPCLDAMARGTSNGKIPQVERQRIVNTMMPLDVVNVRRLAERQRAMAINTVGTMPLDVISNSIPPKSLPLASGVNCLLR